MSSREISDNEKYFSNSYIQEFFMTEKEGAILGILMWRLYFFLQKQCQTRIRKFLYMPLYMCKTCVRGSLMQL